MNIDEYKALRLRRSQLKAEIASINVRLDAYDFGDPLDTVEVGEDYPDTRPMDEEELAHPVPPKPKPKFRGPDRDTRREDRDFWAPRTARGTSREQFYKDAENDFRNTDSNGNYVTPPEDC